MPNISRKKRILLLVLGLAAFAIVAHRAYRTLAAQKAEQAAAASGGDLIPEGLSLEKVNGGTIALSELSGKVTVINFWAGWCTPCLREMPGLYALYKRLSPKGFEVLAVNMDDDPAKGLDVLLKKVGAAPFPVYKGAGSELADRFEIGGLPYTVVVNRDRKVVYARAGEIDWKDSSTVKLIEGIL